MNRKNLETLVLVLGLVVIGAAVFFIFIRQQTPSSIFVTNLIISLGFLIYVIYSILATNNLNKEIRGLSLQIVGLKEQIVKKRKLLEERQARIEELEKEVADRDEVIGANQVQLAKLEEQVSTLQEQVQNLTPPEPG